MMKIKSEFPDEVKVWFPFSLEGQTIGRARRGDTKSFLSGLSYVAGIPNSRFVG
jgi:hypothetical protein